MKGQAADISIQGVAPKTIAKYAESIGMLGIGLYGNFVHVDTRTTKSFWYGSEQAYRETFGGKLLSKEEREKILNQTLTDNDRIIWQYLKNSGLTDAGAAGLMGNLFYESGLISLNLEDSKQSIVGHTDSSYTKAVDNGTYKNFVNDGAGYGLAQWTHSTRKQDLLTQIKNDGVSISDLNSQLKYLIWELENRTEFSSVNKLLRQTTSIKEASDKVLEEFENPKVKNYKVRETKSVEYYNRFAGGNFIITDPPKISITEYKNAKCLSNLANREINYLVVHYTASHNSNTGQSNNVAVGWDKKTEDRASADFIVDDTTILQYNPDIENKYSWHCGDKDVDKSKGGGTFFGMCLNNNSIGVEICSTYSGDSDSPKPNDPGFKFTDKVLNLARALIQNLMVTYRIDINHVIRHFDVTGKPCPGIIGWNTGTGSDNEDKWLEFKNSLGQYEVVLEEVLPTAYCARVITIGDKQLHVYQNRAEDDGTIIKSYKRNDIIVVLKEEDGWGYTGKGWFKIEGRIEKISASAAIIQYIAGSEVTLRYDPITKELIYPGEMIYFQNGGFDFLSHDEKLDWMLKIRQYQEQPETEIVLSNQEFMKKIVVVLEEQDWENKEQCQEKIQLVLKSATSSKNSLLESSSSILVKTIANPLKEVSEKEILERLDGSKKDIINYFRETYKDTGWNRVIESAPETLNFWFDFMNTDGEMGKYSVHTIGDRAKVVNDDKITAIYFQETPQILFLTPDEYSKLIENKEDFNDMTGYTFIKLQPFMENYFTISSQGKSAKDELDSLLYQHTNASEGVTLTSLPIYHLQPNNRIFIQDKYTGINGEYIVNKITIPLQYNGTSSITTAKAVERIY